MKETNVLVAMVLMSATVRSDIVATASDFKIDCGTTVGQIVSVTYTGSTSTNRVAKLSSRRNRRSCSADTKNTAGELVIPDVSTNCDIIQPDTTKPRYLLHVTLEEVAGFYLKKDPTFTIVCDYGVGMVAVKTN